MSKTKTHIIIQFQLAENKIEDLFAFESSLTKGMEQNFNGYVDGNDIGGTTYNIYIFPNKGGLGGCLENIKMWLKVKRLLNAAIIARITPNGKSMVEHPQDYTGVFTYGL